MNLRGKFDEPDERAFKYAMISDCKQCNIVF